jgi:rSAM/selenodomain-associated transferase 2
MISIIVPVLDDVSALRQLLDDLDAIAWFDAERIVVDGGSTDGSMELAQQRVDIALRAPTGRARQLAAGVARAHGKWLWLLHADSRVDASVWGALRRAVEQNDAAWGRFDVRLTGNHAAFRLIETLMNFRSRWSSICTGDQGIFVRRDLLELVDGIPNQPLMEDIELTKRLRRYARPICIDSPLGVSPRRWQERGIVATILLMWRLRLRYFFGAAPETLVQEYYHRDP